MHKLIGALSLASALLFIEIMNPQVFDPAGLPSIKSITATTDVRPFLAPGVPRELRRAALSRAWVMDPHIRDFRGLQENEWDFSNAIGIPGFGPLEPSESTATLPARTFAETEAETATGQSR